MVLGLWDGHDAGVALVVDGALRIALSEERISRVKRASGFPFGALTVALRTAGVEPEAVDRIMVPGQYGRLMHRLADHVYRGTDPQRNPTGFASLAVRTLEVGISRIPGVRSLESEGSRGVLAARLRRLGFRAPIHFVGHHDAHAFTAALVGPPGAMLVTMDGYGDGLAGTIDAFEPGRIALPSPADSPALVYGAVTHTLGFGEGDEGKVMGLAASGDPAVLARWFEARIGPGSCDPQLGGREGRALLRRHRREDVAAALQARVESVVLDRIERHRRARRSLAVSGGLFANVALNGRLAERFSSFDCFPHMGDGGLCVGAARAAVAFDFGLPFYGPAYSERAIDSALQRRGLVAEAPVDPEGALLQTILEGGIAARWFGRSEFGPRALGHRSILLRADDPRLADRLNQQLGRDEFMPFAPIRRLGAGSATMTVVVKADAALRERCPAAVHVDGTARTQLVDAAADPRLWRLLERAEAAGLPALINTSFNRHGEPIVESPDDAIESFLGAGLDILQLGHLIVRKPGGAKRGGGRKG